MNYNIKMKRQLKGYYRNFFGTWKYFRAVGIILLAGIMCLSMAVPVLGSSAQYYFDNLSISEAEDKANDYGWTDERTAYVQELVEARDAKAKNNQIYSWCITSGKTSFGVYVRNTQIISYLAICIIGIAAVLFAGCVILRDIRNYNSIKKCVKVQIIDMRD